jgi:hypothetical protein
MAIPFPFGNGDFGLEAAQAIFGLMPTVGYTGSTICIAMRDEW